MNTASAVLTYHIRPDTEVTLERQNSGTIVLTFGSTSWNSPSGTAIHLFLDADGADLRRLRDAIDAHLAATEAAGGAS